MTSTRSPSSFPSLPSFQELLSISHNPRHPQWRESTISSLSPLSSVAMRWRNEVSDAQRLSGPHLYMPSVTLPDNSVATPRHSGTVDDASVKASSSPLSNDAPEAEHFIYQRRNAPHKRNRNGSPCVSKPKYQFQAAFEFRGGVYSVYVLLTRLHGHGLHSDTTATHLGYSTERMPATED